MTCLDLVLEGARVVVAEVGSEAEDAHEEEGDQAVAEGSGVPQLVAATVQVVQGVHWGHDSIGIFLN